MPNPSQPPTSQIPFNHQRLLEEWRRSLTMDDVSDPNDVVVAELAEYFKLSPEEVRERCVNWKKYSLEEWQAKDRTAPEGLLDFYQTQVSWIFDTMWYHANQYHGIASAPAESVIVAERFSHLKGGSHLDFGAGPGSSSLFFHKLGWEVSLADISTTMLNFAKWRLQKHGITATFYDISKESLPPQAFDLITCFDVMVHVPNVRETLLHLHRALKPGGYLVFNIDNLPATLENHGHLYEEQWPILRHLRKLGFRRHSKISYFHLYEKIERTRLGTKFITIFDLLRYNEYVTFVGNRVRAIKRRLNKTVA